MRHISAACLLVLVAGLLLPGCGSTSDGLRDMTTSIGVNLPPGIAEPAAPPIKAWPPGIATLIMGNGFKMSAVDRDGVRWSQEMQTRKESESPTPLSGMAVSNNQKFVAYVEHRKYVAVRSIRDGKLVGRVPYQAQGETYLDCVSSDGYLVALDSSPLDLPAGTTPDQVPHRVTVIDMRTGQATVQKPDISPFAWLPGHRLLVKYDGQWSDAYTYDPADGTMEKIPGMELVMAVSDSGAVFGGTVATETAPPTMSIWDGHAMQPLKTDVESASGLDGAFNAAGDAFATLIEGAHGEPLGWQLYRLVDGRWQASGPIAENTWMRESPVALSADGKVTWSTLERNTGEVVLLSHDFGTGEWKEWLPNLPVKLGPYGFDAIIPGR